MTPSGAAYANHGHYIAEGWSTEPKESFKALARIIAARAQAPGLRILDVGCATGELLGYLATQIELADLVGVDVTDDLLVAARARLPQATFDKASALALPEAFDSAFDIVTATGCMSIFDETEIDAFWDNLFRVARPGGLIVVLSPLNEFGVDAMIRHRKRRAGVAGGWETGWNIFAVETIRELVAARGGALELEPFRIPFALAPREDPVRTWTMRTEGAERQLTNGLKLLVDHSFMIVRKAP